MVGPGDAESWTWPLLVAIIISIPEAISMLATILQRSRIGSPLPQELEGIYDPGEYETSNRYTKAKTNFSLVKSVWDFAIVMAFWFMKGFPWLDEFCTSAGWRSEISTGLLFIGIFFLCLQVLDLPWDIYRTFVLEEKFGFNKTTPCTFVKDQAKGLVLIVVLGVPVLSMVLWFFISAGANAWLYVFLALTAIQLALFFLMPAVILPLFFEMIPLPSGTALITGEAAKGAPEFLSGRVFYSHDDFNGRPAWQTQDRRFAGSSAGAVLSVVAADARGGWCIVEGQPGQGGVVYATSSADLASSDSGVEVPWELTEAGLTAGRQNGGGGGGAGSSGGAGAVGGSGSSATDPLQQKELRTTCVDVGSLRSKLLELADKLGYHGANIYVIDGSTRSAHSNAFCTGFGRFRRICLFDTLLPLMSEGEIVSVLGHEIGHDRLYHVHSALVFAACYSFVQLYALGQSLTSEAISSAFFIREPKVYLGLVFFSVVWSIVDFVVKIPLTVHSRMKEYAADRYSVDADPSYGPLLCSGLTKMVKKSKSNLTPHPLYVFLNYSHPPHDVRLQAIREYQSLKYR